MNRIAKLSMTYEPPNVVRASPSSVRVPTSAAAVPMSPTTIDQDFRLAGRKTSTTSTSSTVPAT